MFAHNFKSKNIIHFNVSNRDITSTNSDSIKKVSVQIVGQHSPVGMTIHYRMDGLGFIPW